MERNKNEITIPFLLRQYKNGAFTGGLMDVAMEYLEEFYDERQQKPIVFYAENTLDANQIKLLSDKLVLVAYKGDKPPVRIV